MENFDFTETSSQVLDMVTMYGMNVLGAIALIIAGWVASRWVANMVYKALNRMPKPDETLNRFASSMVRYAILIFTGIAVLGQFGVQTASLVAVLGAFGLAVGLALQGTLGHVASGVMLLIFRPFKIGDYIEGAGLSGTVEEISLFTTTMNTPDNVHIIIPNGKLWDSAITNWSHNKTRRVDLAIGIDYSDNIDTAMETAYRVIAENEKTLKDPEPLVGITELGDNSVNFTVRAWVKASDYWDVKFSMTKALKEAFDTAGLSIPFPQRTVHLVQSDAQAATATDKKAS